MAVWSRSVGEKPHSSTDHKRLQSLIGVLTALFPSVFHIPSSLLGSNNLSYFKMMYYRPRRKGPSRKKAHPFSPSPLTPHPIWSVRLPLEGFLVYNKILVSQADKQMHVSFCVRSDYCACISRTQGSKRPCPPPRMKSRRNGWHISCFLTPLHTHNSGSTGCISFTKKIPTTKSLILNIPSVSI